MIANKISVTGLMALTLFLSSCVTSKTNRHYTEEELTKIEKVEQLFKDAGWSRDTTISREKANEIINRIDYDKARELVESVNTYEEKGNHSIMPYPQHFTVKASIPGIVKGCEVKMKSIEDKNMETVRSITFDGGFEMSGEIDKPTLVTLRINDKPQYDDGEFPKDRAVTFMLCGGETTITADDFSQVPLAYELGNTPLKQERNVRVLGGIPQRHYREWRDYIYDAEMAQWHVNHVAWKAQYGGGKTNMSPAGLKEMNAAIVAAEKVVDVMTDAFIKAHPDYTISLFLQRERMDNLFAYTNEELDEMLTMFKNNEDQQGYAAFAEQVEQLRKYTKGTPYTDLQLESPDGRQVQLSQYVKKGTITFVDFWASWCGPCRAAIPSVKKMHEALGDKVNILSLSLDTSKDAWKKAMDEEQMPWTQLLVPKESTKTMSNAYQVKGIPYLMIIDQEGRVMMTTHNADSAHAMIKRLIAE